MSSKNRTRRTTTRNIRFPNQMIEQINIALDLKGSGNFSAWVIEACRRRLINENILNLYPTKTNTTRAP
ncbi:YlcI/YnfO family protein, partial [Escherichia coli]|nr:YlcI/YnfO family protein [Escherichia coli]